MQEEALSREQEMGPGIEPGVSRMLSGCDTTTPTALDIQSLGQGDTSRERPVQEETPRP